MRPPLRAVAQTGKPIRLVVPFGPGTSADTVARAVGDEFGKALGQTVVVEDSAGAAAAQAAAPKAAA